MPTVKKKKQEQEQTAIVSDAAPSSTIESVSVISVPTPTTAASSEPITMASVTLEAGEGKQVLLSKIKALEEKVAKLTAIAKDSLNDLGWLAKTTHSEYAQRRHREVTKVTEGLL